MTARDAGKARRVTSGPSDSRRFSGPGRGRFPCRQAPRGLAKRGLAGAARALAGCALLALGRLQLERTGAFAGPFADIGAAPVPDVQSQPLAGPTVGQTVGTGPVRVGLILPLTQNGQPSSVGVSLRNAAQLAVEESGMNDVTMMIVDDHGTPDGAAQAAQAVVGAGAEIILGPLLAADVREVGRVAKAAGRPVIAFSTDESVARPASICCRS